MPDTTIKVLLIDGDEDEYVLIRNILSESRTGRFEAEWASTYEEGLAKLLEGKHDALPESAFLYCGTIEDVIEKAKAIQGA